MKRFLPLILIILLLFTGCSEKTITQRMNSTDAKQYLLDLKFSNFAAELFASYALFSEEQDASFYAVKPKQKNEDSLSFSLDSAPDYPCFYLVSIKDDFSRSIKITTSDAEEYPEVTSDVIAASIMGLDSAVTYNDAKDMADSLIASYQSGTIGGEQMLDEYTYFMDGYTGMGFCAYHNNDLFLEDTDVRTKPYTKKSFKDAQTGERIRIEASVTDVVSENGVIPLQALTLKDSDNQTISANYFYNELPVMPEKGEKYIIYGTMSNGQLSIEYFGQ